jgi:predicted Holliday junction resolvase-like endonuclease
MENKKTIIIVIIVVVIVGVYLYYKNKKEKEAAAKKLEADLKKAEETKKLLAKIKDKFKGVPINNTIKPLTRKQQMMMAEESKQ